LKSELFIELQTKLMHRRMKPVRLNLDSLPVHIKRTGRARRPLQKGEKLHGRSFFQAPSVAYICDYWVMR
jgi:hypothetical protein